MGIDLSPEPSIPNQSMSARQDHFRAGFLSFVSQHALEFGSLTLRKALWFWLPAYPEWSIAHKLVSTTYLIVLYVAAAWGALRLWRLRFTQFLVVLTSAFWVTSSLTIVDYDARYRLPAELSLLPLAGAGLELIAIRIGGWRLRRDR